MAGDEPLKFGWCAGPDGAILQHQPWGPDETPVDPLDAQGDRIPGFCPGFFVSANDTKLWKKGTSVYCQCTCHGPDQPEAYPGYGAARQDWGPAPDGDDEDDDGLDDGEQEPAGALPVAAGEPGGQSDAGDERVLDDESDDPRAPSDETQAGEGEVETKRIKYPSGEVARVEVPGLGRGGKPVTNVNWVAYDKTGAELGREWSLTAAKKLLP
jgi:hypothetical protein